jgi:hypothetical protein
MKKDLKRCIEIIVTINEHIVDEMDDYDDALYDELEVLRAKLAPRDKKLVERLCHSVGYVEPKNFDIDESDPGGQAHWLGPT